MRKRVLNNSTKSTIAYTFTSLFSKGLTFLTIPIFTRVMTTEQMGVVNIYNSWFSLIYAISTLSLTSGGYQVALNKYSDRRDQYVSSMLSITSLIAIVISIILLLVGTTTSSVIGLDKRLIFLMCWGLVVSPAMDFWLARQKYEYKYKFATVLTVISALMATGLSLLSVLLVNNSAYVRLLTNFIVIYGINSLLLVYQILKGRTFYERDYWKFSLKIGIPMIAYSMAAQVLNVSDRLMISHFIGDSAVGIYGTLYSICTITQILWNALNASFVPYLHNNIEANHLKTQKYSSLLLGGYTVITVLLTIMAPEIVSIFATQEYVEALDIMPPIFAGVFLLALSNLYSNVLLFYQKTKVILISSISAAIVNIILNCIFIPMIGYQAAAYTTMISYVLLALIQGSYVAMSKFGIKHHLNDVYNNGRIILISTGGVLVCLFAGLFYSSTPFRYILAVTIVSIYVILKKSNLDKILFKKGE